ncbi:MAG: flagellar protein FlgN [Actinomycetia bacterium]|nr:flagellar protein FlgN [Actinomycetes bacterium]MCP4085645.1 flagellar protein FlgN [Actinomycetes bacterium]
MDLSDAATDQLGRLARLLWQHRRLLEDLQYRLEVQNLLLLAGREQWVARVTGEVQETIDHISENEVLRAALVDQLAPQLGLEPGASLQDLANRAPEPWNMILEDHRISFLTSVERIDELSKSARQVLREGLDRTRSMLTSLTNEGPPALSYDATGRSVSSTSRPVLIDHEA